VLDVGSNTVHLLVVDARSGGHPTLMTSEKVELRLAEQLDPSGCLGEAGTDALVQAITQAGAAAGAADCDDMLAFATSALRDAANCESVVDRVRAETGVVLRMLPREDEARYTFLSARRWYGWSADVCWSSTSGADHWNWPQAGRRTRTWRHPCRSRRPPHSRAVHERSATEPGDGCLGRSGRFGSGSGGGAPAGWG
jgi:Ppx/GppA phosphatase family